jgi:putative transposase
VKKSSSKWFKEQEGVDYEFKWQIGYGAFSVSSSKVDVVKNYIKKQKVHHSTRTYKDEIEEFIREYDVIEYDENYFWD